MRFSLKLGAPSPEPWMSGSRQILGVSPKFLELSAANLTFLLQRKGSRKNRSGANDHPRRCGPRGSQGLVSGAEPYVHCVNLTWRKKKRIFINLYMVLVHKSSISKDGRENLPQACSSIVEIRILRGVALGSHLFSANSSMTNIDFSCLNKREGLVSTMQVLSGLTSLLQSTLNIYLNSISIPKHSVSIH